MCRSAALLVIGLFVGRWCTDWTRAIRFKLNCPHSHVVQRIDMKHGSTSESGSVLVSDRRRCQMFAWYCVIAIKFRYQAAARDDHDLYLLICANSRDIMWGSDVVHQSSALNLDNISTIPPRVKTINTHKTCFSKRSVVLKCKSSPVHFTSPPAKCCGDHVWNLNHTWWRCARTCDYRSGTLPVTEFTHFNDSLVHIQIKPHTLAENTFCAEKYSNPVPGPLNQVDAPVGV